MYPYRRFSFTGLNAQVIIYAVKHILFKFYLSLETKKKTFGIKVIIRNGTNKITVVLSTGICKSIKSQVKSFS